MTNDKRSTDIDPVPGDADQPMDQSDTEGHSMLNAQFGNVMATERARDAAKWAAGEKARKQQHERGKDGHR